MIAETKDYTTSVDDIIRVNFPEYYEKTKKGKKSEILSQQEINTLHAKYKNEGDLKARDRLIYSQLKLVYYYTTKFHFKQNGTSLSPEDLLGFANEILVLLIDKYDPCKGKSSEEIEKGVFNKLPTFIQSFLDKYLHKKIKDYGLEIRLPHNQISDKTLQKKYIQIFTKKHGRNPYNGEKMETYETKNKVKILKRVTFKLEEKKIYIEKKINDEWVYDKKINSSPNHTHTVSGNVFANEEGDELLDLLTDEVSTVCLEDNNNMIYQSLKQAVDELNIREKESILLQYYYNEDKKDIPSLLTPDYNSKREIKSLSRTSKNVIDIYIRKNNKISHLTYNVVSNYHVGEFNANEQKHKDVEFISHKYKDIKTTFSNDKYVLGVENAEDIKILHTTCKGTSEIEKYEYDGKTISFNIEYHYGVIFTSMTFTNKRRDILNKLRKQLRILKNKM